MTLEEVIAKCEERVEMLIESMDACDLDDTVEKLIARNDAKCAAEHRQLAEWLKELAERRKLPEIIHCKDCENWDTTWQNDSAPNYHYCPMMDGTYSGDFYCGKAERRIDEQR